MANSVQKDHVGDGVPESPTVCTSPHDSADNISDDDDVGVRPTALSDRAPSVERVLEEVRAVDIVKMTISHSPLFSVATKEVLFFNTKGTVASCQALSVHDITPFLTSLLSPSFS